MQSKTYCGYATIVGKPNVGKSTLLNKILGKKITITSSKAQTTRYKIFGIKTKENIQTIYIDTPGIHKNRKRRLNKDLRIEVKSSLYDVNVIVFVTEGLVWKMEDQLALNSIEHIDCPVLLAINKIDKIKDKKNLLPYLEYLNEKFRFDCIIPISAKTGVNIEELESRVEKFMPEGFFKFQADCITDKDQGFMIKEIIREKLTRLLGEELPYDVEVELQQTETKENGIFYINATVYVEKISQKKIIVGKSGNKIKQIGITARVDIEKFLNKKVFLGLWVKVKGK